MNEVIKHLYDNKLELYNESKYPELLTNGTNELTHKTVIEFCKEFNFNYEYVIVGKGAIYDTEDKNYIYDTLINKEDFTLFI